MEQQRNKTEGPMSPPAGTAGGTALPASFGTALCRFRLDGSLSLLWANDLFYQDAGYTGEEFLRCFPTVRSYYPDRPEEFRNVERELARSLEQNGGRVQLTLRMPRKPKGYAWVRLSGSAEEDPSEGCRVLSAAVLDVDGLVRRQEELRDLHREKTEYFRWMMDEYAGNIYISDMETYELLYLNETSADTLGMRREELLGRKCYEVIQGRTSPCPFCTNDRIRPDSFYEWEFDNPVLERTFMIKNRVVNWEGRRARIELSHDMYSTEYKLAKKDRERDAIIRTIPGGFARVDARDMRTILWYGGGFLQVIGYTAEQFEVELHSQCSYVHPDDLERVTNVMLHSKSSGEDDTLEARVVTRDGTVKILTITCSYVCGEDSWDGIPSFYSIGIDVTKEREEQGRQRKALEEAYHTARIASSAKTNFLSSMSHDIRTPMNAIMGMTAIAQANLAAPEKVRDCLNKINVSSRHLLSLINEVLDMSKIESGKIDLVPEDVDLSELIESVSAIVRPLVEEKRQDLQIHVGQVRHERVTADGDRLRQVFMNLLSNAVKYTPEGGNISLTIQELPSMIPERGRYEFIFEDNGIGMPEDFIPRIFEPFSRAEDSRISKVQGTGLGMAITENIVHMMNGAITVQSTLGKGSRFTVTIPLQLVQEEEPDEHELAGLPVLVVDDDRSVCENAVLLLGELGMRGYWVLSGEEALKHVLSAHRHADDFFAVIVDWKMPGMDGLETVKAIRAKMGEDVPIIIVSAYDYSSVEDEFVKAGADAFITKPLFKSKVLHVLQLFCSGSRQTNGESLAEEKRPELCGKKVLLVEDNELNREIALELLQMQGLSADTAENGREAVERFQQSVPGEYAAILMDIQMPVMDGYEATAAIRGLSRQDARTIPILALTANAFASDIGKAQSSGMNDHISKPIDVERLTASLQKWIGRTS